MSDKTKIFYFCYSHNNPTGGQKDTYRHVDLLNAAGLSAYAVHPGTAFRLTWFENDTRTIDLDSYMSMVNPDTDYTVLPEDLGEDILQFPGRKVIFNKNLVYGFQAFANKSIIRYPYHAPDVIASFVVSQQNSDVLRYAYPHLPIYRMYSDIDLNVFTYRSLQNKVRRVLFPKKQIEAAMTIRHIISSRTNEGLSSCQGLGWHLLENATESEAARLLNESLFLFFPSVNEGLPRLILEAMASGTIVLAYASGPLPEILPQCSAYAHSDYISVCKRIEDVMREGANGFIRFESDISEGRSIAEAFSKERQRTHLLDAWETILLRAPL